MKSFFTSNDEKITEKAFSHSLAVSVFSILLCLVLLCSMTYAWFTDGTVSSSNTLVSGSFALDISVAQDGGEPIAVTAVEGEDGVWSCTLPDKEEEYIVTLTLDPDSTAKGHCIVRINGMDKNTDAIIGDRTANKDRYTKNSPFTFTIQTTENDTVVEFRPVWGVVAESDIKADGVYSADAWAASSNDP